MNSKLLNRNFSLVIVGQIISLFGNQILKFALSLLILDITGSAMIFGTISAVSIIPTVILAPIGGIVADRINKRNIMVFLDYTTAILLSGFLVLFTINKSIILIAVLMIALSIIQSFYTPSVQASVPVMQGEAVLVQSNALVNQVAALSGLLGPILGGAMYGVVGVNHIVLVGAACFAVAATFEIFIKIPHIKSSGKGKVLKVVREDMKESMHFIGKEKPEILKAMLCIAAFSFFPVSMITIGLPYMIRTVLGFSSNMYGVTQGLMAAAGIMGGAITGIIAQKCKLHNLYMILIALGIVILPIGGVFLFENAYLSAYWIITIVAMFVQFGGSIFSILTLSVIQKKTPMNLIGKTMGYIMSISMCAQPLGQALYGVLFDAFSTKIYIVIGFTTFFSVVIGLVGKRVFKNFI